MRIARLFASCCALLALSISAANAAPVWTASYAVESLETHADNWVRIKLRNQSGAATAIDCPDGGMQNIHLMLGIGPWGMTQESLQLHYSTILSAAHTGTQIRFKAGVSGTQCWVERVEVAF